MSAVSTCCSVVCCGHHVAQLPTSHYTTQGSFIECTDFLAHHHDHKCMIDSRVLIKQLSPDRWELLLLHNFQSSVQSVVHDNTAADGCHYNTSEAAPKLLI